MSDRYPELEVASREEWRAWLAQHHERAPGIWLVTFKRPDPRYLSVDAIVEEALCFGWIDSLPRRVDECRSARLLTPRKPGSNWSRVNHARVERLLAEGRMAPAGLAAVAAAQTDGSWSRLDAVEDLREPDDLRAALDAEPDARGYWDAFPRSAKRAILEWIGNAKREPTRRRRIEETVAQAAQNRRANQWRQPEPGGPGA